MQIETQVNGSSITRRSCRVLPVQKNRDFPTGQCKFGDKCKFKRTEKIREPGVCKIFSERGSWAHGQGCNSKHVQLGRGIDPSQSPRSNQSAGDIKKGDAKNHYNRTATPSPTEGNVPKQGEKLFAVKVMGENTVSIKRCGPGLLHVEF